MNYLLDTNILLTYVRKNDYSTQIDTLYAPLSNEHTSFLSVVSIGELKAVALKNGWGIPKLQKLEALLTLFIVIDINVETILNKYAEIDAYSQGKLPSKPSNFSARNMGKNDLWIAATASVLGLKLLTTDHDFEHLKNEFIDVDVIEFV